MTQGEAPYRPGPPEPPRCPACSERVGLRAAGPTTTRCRACGTEVELPPYLVALREEAAGDPAWGRAAVLFRRWGAPPSPAGVAWARRGLLAVMALGVVALALVVGAVVAAPASARSAAEIGFDPVDVGGGGVLLAAFVFDVALALGVGALIGAAHASVLRDRAALQAGFAARPAERPKALPRCRGCDAPVDVDDGAHGARCAYCGTDNLASLPPAWVDLGRRERSRGARDLALEEAALADGRARATARRWTIALATFCTLFAAGVAAGGWALRGPPLLTETWSAAVGGPRVLHSIDTRLSPDAPAGVRTRVSPERFETRADGAFRVALRKDETVALVLRRLPGFTATWTPTGASAPALPSTWQTVVTHQGQDEIDATPTSFFRAPFSGWFDLTLEGPVRAFAFNHMNLPSLAELDDGPSILWTVSTDPPPPEAPAAPPARVLRGDEDLLSIGWSPDGTRIVATNAVTSRVWDARSGASLGTHPLQPTSTFSADGRSLRILRENAIDTLDLASGTVRSSEHAFGVTQLLDARGDTLALASGSALHVLDLGPYLVHTVWRRTYVIAAALSPDVHTVAVADLSEASIVDVATGEPRVTLPAPASALAFSPDGRKVAVASSSRILLVEAQTGRVVRTLAGHAASVFAVAFSPDGRTLASIGGDGALLVWDLTGPAPSTVPTWRACDSAGGAPLWTDVAFSPDGPTLAAVAGKSVLLFAR